MAEYPSQAVSESFQNAVRQALDHLYEPGLLAQSPLVQVFQIERRGPSALAQIVQQAVESVRPVNSLRHDPRQWRPYRAIRFRYIEGLSQRDVGNALTLSVRQVRREEAKGLDLVCHYLWELYHLRADKCDALAEALASDDSSSGESPQPSALEAEFTWIASQVPLEPTMVSDLVRQSVEVVSPLAELRSVALSLEFEDRLAPVLARPAILRQAFVHLLTTAIDAEQVRQIRVVCAKQRDEVSISIASHDIDHDAHDASAGRPDDSAIDKVLCARSGARLVIGPDRAPEHTVSLLLPILERRSVLVIDDNPDTLQLYERYLADTDYSFHGSSRSDDGLARALELRPKIIVTDIMLPNVDGWQILQRLREHPATRGVPVIVSTVLEGESLATALGAACFLRKPVTRPQFLAALAQLVAEEKHC